MVVLPNVFSEGRNRPSPAASLSRRRRSGGPCRIRESAMKKWFKRIVISLAVLVMVAVVGVAIFLLTFDPNTYKHKLSEAVQARYDRALTIDGDIELSLFPRLGLFVQDVSLSEAGRPEDEFASIDSARVAVAVWPLLFNKLVVDHVALNGFRAQVVRDAEGRFNFRNLVDGGLPVASFSADAGNPPAPAPVSAPTPGQAAAGGLAGSIQAGVNAVIGAGEAVQRTEMSIDIAGLDLRGGEVFLRDEQSGSAVRIVGLNANTGRVTFDQPFDMNVSARIEGEAPAIDAGFTGQGLIKLDPAAMQYSAQRLDLRVEGSFPDLKAKALTARGNVSFDALIRSLDVSGLELVFQGEVPGQQMTGVESSLAIPRLSIDPVRQHLKLEKLAVRARGAMQERPFELSLDAPALRLSAEDAKGDAVTGRWRIDGDDALDASFNLAGLSGSLDALEVREVKLDGALKQGDRLVKMQAASPLTASLIRRSLAFSAMKGDVDITDPNLPKGSLHIPVIGSLSADLLKDQATAKINAMLEGGKFDLTANVAGLAEQPRLTFALAVDTLDLDKLAPPAPVAALAPAAPEGKGDGAGEKPAAPAQAAPPSDEPVDFSALAGMTASGTIKVGDLRVRGLTASDVAAALKIDKGRLDVSELSAMLYEGKLTGSLFADAAQGGLLGAKLSLAGVSLDPLLTRLAGESRLRGKGNLVVDLKTSGATQAAWRGGLAGTVQARLRDGALKGVNVAQLLRELKAALGGSPAAVEAAGAVRETDFTELDADLTFAKGVGTVRKLNMASPLLRASQGSPAIVNVANETLDLVVNVRVVNTSTGQDGKDLDILKGVTIPVHMAGPFDKPVYSVLWNKAGSDAVRRALENRLKQEVLREAGVPDEAVRDIGNALKGILGR